MTFQSADGDLEALRGFDFRLREEEFICVLGPSGSGKTTLLRLIAGLLRPSEGEIRFNDGTTAAAHRAGLPTGEPDALAHRAENIALPLELRGRSSRGEIDAKRRRDDRLVGLAGFRARAWPPQLSGGMAQRVAMARALVQEPDLLLLDEPFGSLDALTREKMGAELLRIWQAQRKAVIMVTHSISEALLLSDRVLVFSPRPGTIVRDLAVPFPRPRKEELRYLPAFQEMERELRATLQ